MQTPKIDTPTRAIYWLTNHSDQLRHRTDEGTICLDCAGYRVRRYVRSNVFNARETMPLPQNAHAHTR